MKLTQFQYGCYSSRDGAVIQTVKGTAFIILVYAIISSIDDIINSVYDIITFVCPMAIIVYHMKRYIMAAGA